ncbi:hypothetical protein G6011_05290 [Alternaria panax]|uniref:Uncharacterized protein n=1 Tax=Alternaria panax TaxID=48097 RepID=A0AAD4FBK8_9PLEO|nr:hypothetical protein G6011_05290 [Alternaria panax]
MEQRGLHEMHEMHSVREETSHVNTVAPKVPETTNEPTFLSRASSMTAREPVVGTLHTSLWSLVVFIFYATLSAFTWTVLCVASNRPIGSKQDYTNQQGYEIELKSVLTKHQNAIRAAQILQVVVSLLTIPITSAICSMALAAFIQTGGARTKLNLRQTMALADQGWISPRIWTMYSKVGSLPFYFAFGLTFVGAVCQILLQTFARVTPAQMASKESFYGTDQVPDLPTLIKNGQNNGNPLVVRLRSILETTEEDQYEPFLWVKQKADRICQKASSGQCTYPGWQSSFLIISDTDQDVWFTPLVSDYNTGVYDEPQYAPRINTAVTYANMTASEWPSQCVRDREGVFFAEYHGSSENYETHLTACMPVNISKTPWNATHDRQDITEELYLNVTADSARNFYYYRVTAKTSLGYFELPSAKNGYRAGPLLDNCSLSSLDNWEFDRYSSWSKDLTVRDTNGTYAGNVTQTIGDHIGPLTALGLALFGEGSFIEKRISNPSAFVTNRALTYYAEYDKWYIPWSKNCVSFMPLSYTSSGRRQCLEDSDHDDEGKIIRTVGAWVRTFSQEEVAKEAFTVGAFLANKEWLDQARSSRISYQATRMVATDPGVTINRTTMTIVEIIIGSIFLGFHLLGLLALTIYAVYAKPFMPWLGSEVMVKAGTVFADILSAAEGDNQWKQTMAACPGFVGDEEPTNSVGKIAFGAVAGLSRLRDRKFEAL